METKKRLIKIVKKKIGEIHCKTAKFDVMDIKTIERNCNVFTLLVCFNKKVPIVLPMCVKNEKAMKLINSDVALELVKVGMGL